MSAPPEKVEIRRSVIEELIRQVKQKIRSNGGTLKSEPLVSALEAVVREVSVADLRSELEVPLSMPVTEEDAEP